MWDNRHAGQLSVWRFKLIELRGDKGRGEGILEPDSPPTRRGVFLLIELCGAPFAVENLEEEITGCSTDRLTDVAEATAVLDTTIFVIRDQPLDEDDDPS